MIINNASSRAINLQNGTTPDVSGALQDWYQPMVFETVVKTVSGFQVVETPTVYNFQGVIQPFTERQLLLKPEGQRAWTWFLMHSDTSLALQVDDVVNWLGIQTRVMSRGFYGLEGYIVWHLVQDYTGSGP